MADDDAEFVSRCQRGNIDAFEVLVARHQKKMLNIVYRITGDYDDACEVVQEVFLSAYRAINKFRGNAKFSTWLTGYHGEPCEKPPEADTIPLIS
jgi:RNA polymerase sigma-70 factor, ECF subfamily